MADIESTGSAPSLADAVYQELVISIRDGKYHPGERIKEASVAKALNVSRTPVREAIRRLHQRLEGIAARFAAQHASDAEIEMMDDILERSKTALDDKRLLNQINWELHYAIYHGAHNRFLLKSIDAISDAMALLRGAHHIPDDRPAELYTEHKKIVDAIRSRDPEAAEQAAHEHIKNSYKTHLTTTGG